MNCDDRELQLNALLDGELPAAEMAVLTGHLAGCPECARRLAQLGGLRAALAAAVPEEEISPEFYARISRSLDRESGGLRHLVWVRRFGLVAVGAAMAAMVTLAVLPDRNKTGELMAVRDAILRDGAAGVIGAAAPVVAGFRVLEARQDVVAGHLTQVVAYQQGDRSVTLCIWPAGGEPAHGVRQAEYRGTLISYWNDGRLEYWAASTGRATVLASFVAAVRAAQG